MHYMHTYSNICKNGRFINRVQDHVCVYFSTKASKQEIKKAAPYSHTMNLGGIKMKARLSDSQLRKHDISIREATKFSSLYKWQQQEHKNKKEFTLHDGPPYANGKLHMGHAVNKILKDIMVRYKLLNGHLINFVPGWDCHGLPIELKALELQLNQNDSTEINPIEIRQKARSYAKKMIEAQRKEFDDLGLLVDWEQIYQTYSKEYIVQHLKLFYELYSKGLIYQDVLPVNLSPSTQTVLADAEIELLEHTTDTAYVALQCTNLSSKLKNIASNKLLDNLYLPIWTSKPWTLPMNQFICASPTLIYSIIEMEWNSKDILLIWAKELLQNLNDITKDYKIIGEIQGNDLKDMKYTGPLSEEIKSVLLGDFVTAKRGSGLVHISPAHGQDDYFLAKNFGTPVINWVDMKGKYIEGIGWNLEGLNVIDEGDKAVLKLLEENADSRSLLLKKDLMTHSHPHDWRSKKPLITSVLNQWFFNINKLKTQCLEAIENVNVNPEYLKKDIANKVLSRNHWCISRQRVWGVPLPVFFDTTTKEPVLTRDIIDHLIELFKKEDLDIWWTKSEEELLPKTLIEEYSSKGQPLPKKGTDILDIWWDSGCSWQCVLNNENKVADLYLEGIDQVSAWFQTSLLTSVGARGIAPFKNIYIHGFVVDKDMRKMSKSIGNVTTPEQLMYGTFSKNKGKRKKDKDLTNEDSNNEALGADGLRLWVCWSATSNAMSIKDTKSMKYKLNKIRMTFKFMLNLIQDYPRHENEELPVKIPIDQLLLIDRYYLHRMYIVLNEVNKNFEDLNFRNGVQALYNFISDEVSDTYLNLVKDRMVFDNCTDNTRRSGRTVIELMLDHLLVSVAPILPHLAEEVMSWHPYRLGSIFRQNKLLLNDDWQSIEIPFIFEELLELRNQLHLDQNWLGKKGEGLKYGVILNLNLLKSSQNNLFHQLNDAQISEILQVSETILVKNTDSENLIEVHQIKNDLCQRCWKYTAKNNELCDRCKTAVK